MNVRALMAVLRDCDPNDKVVIQIPEMKGGYPSVTDYDIQDAELMVAPSNKANRALILTADYERPIRS